MSYFEITFKDVNTNQQELLVAALAFEGFDGFEQTEDSLKAFINEKEFHENYIKQFSTEQGFSYVIKLLKDKNWNSEWEKNFKPVIVEKVLPTPGKSRKQSKKRVVGLRADFHEPIKNVEHEIIITPKMSFGTGHHGTTYAMMLMMYDMDFKAKLVLDFGTGTGVLAILAEKLGAEKVIAIDNDDWSIENATENLQRNGCTKIEVIKTDNPGSLNSFDIILANINRNVIMENLPLLVKHLNKGGTLLVSGLLGQADKEMVTREAKKLGFRWLRSIQRNNWSAIMFTH